MLGKFVEIYCRYIFLSEKKMAFKAKDIIKDNVTQNRMLNGIIL